MGIVVIGKDQLKAALQGLAGDLQSADVRTGFQRAAALIRDKARGEAPSYKGTLRRAIVSFASRRRGKRAEPAAWARVNVLSGRVKAPHGHLVEFGTKPRRPKKRRYMKFEGALGFGIGVTYTVFTKRVAAIRPNPYFKRAVERSDSAALNVAIEAIRKKILKRNKPTL